MSSRKQRDDETVARAQADLKRLGEQSEKLLGARQAQDEDDANDPIVIWGKRLGRILTYALGIYLVYWFLARYGVI
jgi:hypothetical protein